LKHEDLIIDLLISLNEGVVPKPEDLNSSKDDFNIAVGMAQEKGLVKGAIPILDKYTTRDLKITLPGIEYLKEKLEFKKME